MMETKEQERKWHLIRNDNGDAMRYGELRLAVPTLDDGDDETENVTIDVPQFEYA